MKKLHIWLFGAVFVAFLILPSAASAYALGPTTPGKWGPSPIMGTGATVTWSLMGSGLGVDPKNPAPPHQRESTALGGFMPAGFKAEIISAFDAWSDVADITFVEAIVDPNVGWLSPGADVVDIRFAGHTFDGAGGTLAHGYYPPLNYGAAAGDIHFDIAEIWKIGFGDSGFDIFTVAAHEIGHAIGLNHENTDLVALMDPYYSEDFRGLLADDVAGAQHIYGPAVVVPIPAAWILFGSVMTLLLGRVRRRTA